MKIVIKEENILSEEMESQQFSDLYRVDDVPLFDPVSRYHHLWLIFSSQ